MKDKTELQFSTTSNKKHQLPSEHKFAAFVDSMTFASAGTSLLPSCDCEDCGLASDLPDAIRLAVQEHKRRKLATEPMKRTQVKSLMARCPATRAEIWQWMIPIDAEPLIAFGNADVTRIMYVKTLPIGLTMKSIGTGVIGSSYEEKGRVSMPWKEGDAIVLPNNGNKAMGWVVTRTKAATGKIRDGPAVLYIAKIRTRDIDIHSNDTDIMESWSKRLAAVSSRLDSPTSPSAETMIHPDDAKLLEGIVADLQQRT